MIDEIEEFEKYLASFRVVEKPKMPNFDISAYTDSEYVDEINSIISDFNGVDDEYLTIRYLKGR